MRTAPSHSPNRLRTAAAAVVATMAALPLGACQNTSLGNMNTTETVGTLGGAVAGGLLGSRFGGGSGKLATTAIGTLLGAYAGQQLTRHFTSADQNRASDAEERAVSSNQTITWNNPQSGNSGTIQPQRTYQGSSGQTCRDYTHSVVIDGSTQAARGTACQQPDGTWKLIS
ncbi:RT0821/Lpp0805 family surface protein [Azospirillum picis]|uniref:17 kDa surface antigen n=1 Tax=Azospirillum picis TaxID=488438 RepID=A0ABU0MTX3_9PROT|nr:RT0821/Lpp0805 family surface protein [Azospirillum picis]MBP2303119.1 surface antigen [Azospirillum picis]MDQ0536871.1 surface antigen [Azospirillum picis]